MTVLRGSDPTDTRAAMLAWPPYLLSRKRWTLTGVKGVKRAEGRSRPGEAEVRVLRLANWMIPACDAGTALLLNLENAIRHMCPGRITLVVLKSRQDDNVCGCS